MKHFVASMVIVLATLSTAGAQQTCYPGSQPNLSGVAGGAIGALVGSTIGDGRGQALATGVGVAFGGVIGQALSPRAAATRPTNPLLEELDGHRDRMIKAAVSGHIPMPRKAMSVRLKQQLTHCQEIEPGTLACQDSTGTWHIVQ